MRSDGMFKVIKDFTTPSRRFKAGMVVNGEIIDGPFGAEWHVAAKNIEADEPPRMMKPVSKSKSFSTK